MEIIKTHIVIESGNNGPDPMSTPVLVYELKDGNFFKMGSRGYLHLISKEQMVEMQQNYSGKSKV